LDIASLIKNKMQSKLILTLSTFFGIQFALVGQTLNIGFGPIYTLTNQSVRMINSKEDFQNTDYHFVFSYEQYLKIKKISIMAQFSQYEGHTWIKFNKGSVIAPDGFPTLGVGYSGVNISRFDILLCYNLINPYKYFYLKPTLGIGLQTSKENGSEYGAFERQNGPDYVELEPITAITMNVTQIVPLLGIKTGFTLFHNLEVTLSINGLYGFKSFQKMFFKYTYKGIEQPTAIFEARGTGIYTSIGVGYRFFNKKVK